MVENFPSTIVDLINTACHVVMQCVLLFIKVFNIYKHRLLSLSEYYTVISSEISSHLMPRYYVTITPCTVQRKSFDCSKLY